ncbi:hypothetical protein GCM10008107_05140 [Psychrosphaera saromensis]|uniref:Outer membrane protein beta-barrel domain-containing protein n=1 Tax=Psychrosphaera saromensis TaxID=716813 RepID=A0A2S7UX30_9GAMM|nr:hypothetical protein [Psychrosphaera saromensis]PQJ54554.1 hypothetical protein BTO11_13455 [Psychrosphaera saromensis]GHB58990.1 hypothetical protein GCM10008107_05140 [Psychrosphaera saromensis]GLQ14235.1 hypothetical protein GCM10007917_16900 [Psychrosphaera saromensis]
MKLRFILVVFSLLVSEFINASEASPTWNHVDLSYKSYSYDDIDDFAPTGLNISASYLVVSKFFITSQHEAVKYQYPAPNKDNTFELSVVTFGVGLKHSITNTTDIWVGTGIASLKVKTSDRIFLNKEESDGIYSEIGIRSMLSSKVEFFGRCQRRTIEAINGNDKSTEYFTFGSRYLLNRSVSLFSSFGTGQDNSSTTSIGLSVKF